MSVHIASEETLLPLGLRTTIAADLWRYDGAHGLGAFVREFLRTPAFRFTSLLRCCQALQARRSLYLVYILASLWMVRVGRLYGLSIPVQTRIGPGLYIGHYGSIVVHHDAVLGANCNLSQGVTIGQTNRGLRCGVPEIGSEVYIGPGAKVIGCIRIGDRAAIGANAVVTRDVPASGVAVGIPARVISTEGSEGYIQYPCPADGLRVRNAASQPAPVNVRG